MLFCTEEINTSQMTMRTFLVWQANLQDVRLRESELTQVCVTYYYTDREILDYDEFIDYKEFIDYNEFIDCNKLKS